MREILYKNSFFQFCKLEIRIFENIWLSHMFCDLCEKSAGLTPTGVFRLSRPKGPPGTPKVKFVTGREFPPVGGPAPDAVVRKLIKGREFPLAGGHAPDAVVFFDDIIFVKGREFPPVGGHAPDVVVFCVSCKFAKGREFPLAGGHAPDAVVLIVLRPSVCLSSSLD